MITFIWGLLFSLTAGAVEGEFSYNGQFDVLIATRQELVYSAISAGKVRLQELMSDGYACQPSNAFMVCKKKVTGTKTPNHPANVQPDAQNVTFFPVQAMEILTEGDNVIQHTANQQIVVNGHSFDSAIYLESTEIVKVTMGDPNQTQNYYSFVVGKDTVSQVFNHMEDESKWVSMIYLVEAKLNRVEKN